MCKNALYRYSLLLFLLLLGLVGQVFSQYPDKYIQYRSIPHNSYSWDKALECYATDKFDSALFYANKAETEFLESKSWNSYLFINSFKAQVLGENRKPKDAIAILSNAHDKVRNLIDTVKSVEFAENLFLTGRVYSLVNNYKLSEFYFKRTALLFDQANRYPEILALVYHILFQLNDKMMRADIAQEYLLKAIKLVREGDTPYAKAIYYHIQADVLDKTQPVLKTDFYEAAVNAFEAGGFTNDYFYYYSMLKLTVQYSTYQPNYVKAVLYCKKAEEFATRNRFTKAKVYGLNLAIGDTYRCFDKYDLALPYFIKARDITSECFGNKSFEFLLTDIYLGRMYRCLGNFEQAAKYYYLSYDIGSKGWSGRFPHEFTLYGEICRMYSSMGQSDSALYYAQKRLCYDFKGAPLDVNQIPPIPDDKNTLRYYNALIVKLEAYKQLYEATKDTSILRVALAHCDHASLFLERINEKAIEEFSGLKNSARVKTMASFAVYFCLQEYEQCQNEKYLRRAIEYCEESKANYLRFRLIDRQLGNIDTVQDAMNRRVALLEEKLQNANLSKNIDIHKQLSDSILNLKSQLFEWILTRGKRTNISSFKSPKLKMYNFDSIQQNIPNGTSIVVYQIVNYDDEEEVYQKDLRKNKHQLVAFCIDKSHINYFTTVISDNDIESMHSFIGDIKTGDMAGFKSIGENAYGILLKQFAEVLSATKNIVVISDSQLPDIPFECLTDDVDGKLLCNKFAISYHYSVGLWNRSHEQTSIEFPKSFVAIAPDYSMMDADSSLLASNDSSIERGLDNLAPLPMAKEEVTQVGELFSSKNVGDVKVERYGVTKAAFENIVEKYGIVHVASHGYADMDDFRNSGICFSATKDSSNYNNNLLDLNEISHLKISANLVVLSACKTSVGDKLRGEGTMALPRGFIYAGVPNVVASLWKVNDAKTKDLMVSFYKHLLEDKISYSEALRLAKLDCIKKGFLPMDWAGFVIIGN
ncbi:MAG: CHAT domain-containing protein [Bacteroidales bacterium]